MGDITKEDLKAIAFLTAHNSGELIDEVQLSIDNYDVETYRRFVKIALEQREKADRTNEPGGGTRSAAWLREALEHLEYILSH